MCVLEYRRTAIAMNKPPKSGLAFDANFEHPTFQGATAPTWEDPGCHVLEQSRPERAKALQCALDFYRAIIIFLP